MKTRRRSLSPGNRQVHPRTGVPVQLYSYTGSNRPELPAETVRRPECGSYRGMQAHNHHGEMACGPCLRANVAYMRSWRTRGKCAKGLGWPL